MTEIVFKTPEEQILYLEAQVELANQAVRKARAATIRELDKKYGDYLDKKCKAMDEFYEGKLREVASDYEHKLRGLEHTLTFNANIANQAKARTERLEAIVTAVGYCYRNRHIDDRAVKFTGLDKAMEALDKIGGPKQNGDLE